MQKYNLEVSKKENGKYVSVGTVALFIPTLLDFGIRVEPKPVVLDDKGLPVNQGLPVYEDAKIQYVFDAVFAAVKADARNKLETGTANLKEGAVIASTVDELIAVAERDGAAMLAFRAMLTAFKEFLTHSGKTAATQAAILTLASNKASLKLQPSEMKSRFLVHLTNFAASLTVEQVSQFAKSLGNLEEACSAADALDDM